MISSKRVCDERNVVVPCSIERVAPVLGFVAVESGNFPCDACHRVYKYKRNLQQHRKYECNKEPSFSCQFCPYRAKKRNNLKSHMVLKHQDMFKLQ